MRNLPGHGMPRRVPGEAVPDSAHGRLMSRYPVLVAKRRRMGVRRCPRLTATRHCVMPVWCGIWLSNLDSSSSNSNNNSNNNYSHSNTSNSNSNSTSRFSRSSSISSTPMRLRCTRSTVSSSVCSNSKCQ